MERWQYLNLAIRQHNAQLHQAQLEFAAAENQRLANERLVLLQNRTQGYLLSLDGLVKSITEFHPNDRAAMLFIIGNCLERSPQFQSYLAHFQDKQYLMDLRMRIQHEFSILPGSDVVQAQVQEWFSQFESASWINRYNNVNCPVLVREGISTLTHLTKLNHLTCSAVRNPSTKSWTLSIGFYGSDDELEIWQSSWSGAWKSIDQETRKKSLLVSSQHPSCKLYLDRIAFGKDYKATLDLKINGLHVTLSNQDESSITIELPT